jgi:glycosyltransferase involved in cell wall biosynthesis
VLVRRPSAGESSAAALRFLACGTPVAVSALPQFLELPAAVAPRLTPGCEAAEMARLLLAAWRDRSVLRSRREAARRYFLAHHTLERTAAGLFQAFERLAGTA